MPPQSPRVEAAATEDASSSEGSFMNTMGNSGVPRAMIFAPGMTMMDGFTPSPPGLTTAQFRASIEPQLGRNLIVAPGST